MDVIRLVSRWSVIGLAAGFFTTSAGAADTGVAGSRMTVLILGDSLAAGLGVDPAEAFPNLLQEKINAAGLPFEIINAGLSGETSAGGLRRINWLLRRPVDVLMLELGGNDGLRGIAPAATQTNLQQIIDRTREKDPAVRIIVAGMRMPDNLGADYVQAFHRVFVDLAKANQAVLIPFLLEDVGGKPELNQPDMIHPNAKGHAIVADHVWKAMETVLSNLAAARPRVKSGRP